MCQFAAVHAGHDHIREQQVDWVFIPLGDLQGLGTVFCLQHSVTVLLEAFPNQVPDSLLVFHEQYCSCPPQRYGEAFTLADLLDRLLNSREVNFKRRTMSRLAVDPNMAAALLYGSIYTCQA